MKRSKRPATDPAKTRIAQEHVPRLNAAGFIPNTPATLLLGIGNNCRGDDGLGWAFLDRVEKAGNFRGQIEYRYQLQVEDAELISKFETVVFVDACKDQPAEGFNWKKCRNVSEPEFTTHLLKPEAVLVLCSQLYNKKPRACLLTIAGQNWGIKAGLSPAARRNLDKTLSACFTI